MNYNSISIIDNSGLIKGFLDKSSIFPEAMVLENISSHADLNNCDLLLVNTDFTFNDFRYSFERGGLEFIKYNINKLPKQAGVVFFSLEAKENIKQYLQDKWLKYDSKYFIHYPFEKDILLNLLEKAKPASLKTTEMFKVEMRHNLLKLLSSVKHDFLNRIARILPDLKAYRSSFLNGNDIEFDMDFKPGFLKEEILKLSAKISENLQRNEFSYNTTTNESLKDIAKLLEKIPDYIMVFGKKKNLSHDLLNDLENLINSIEEIKQKFENTIGFLRDEQQ